MAVISHEGITDFTGLNDLCFDQQSSSDGPLVDALYPANVESIHQKREVIINKFKELIHKRNQHIADDVFNFVNSVINRKTVFTNSYDILPAAVLSFGGLHKDRGKILELVAETVSIKYKQICHKHESNSINIVSIDSTSVPNRKKFKANHLPAIERKGHSLIILEDVDNINRHVLENILFDLNETNQRKQGKSVSCVLFCVITDIIPIMHLVSPKSWEMIEKWGTIVPRPPAYFRDELFRLALCSDDIHMKLDPASLSLMLEEYLYDEYSLKKVLHIFLFAIELHCDKFYRAILCADPHSDDWFKPLDNHRLTKIINEQLQDMPSLPKHLQKKSFAKIMKSLRDYSRDLMLYHSYMMTQLEYIYILTRDEMREVFPTELNDLYEELLDHEYLGQSGNILDAVSRFSKQQPDRVLKRLEQCINNRHSVPEEYKDRDIIEIIEGFHDTISKQLEENKAQLDAFDRSRPGERRSPPNPASVIADNSDDNQFKLPGRILLDVNRAQNSKSSFKTRTDLILRRAELQEKCRLRIYESLCELRNCLQEIFLRIKSPKKHPLHEIFYFDCYEKLKERTRGSTRYYMRRELLYPGDVLRCTCCSKKGDTVRIRSTHPDVCIVSNLLLDQPPEFNIFDFYQEFKAAIDEASSAKAIALTPSKRRKTIKEHEQCEQNNDDKEYKGRFMNALNDLECYGMLKLGISTAKRLAWF